MAGPAEIVEQYFSAWTSKDFEKARSLLHDDLSFTGPIETLDNADALIESIKGLAQTRAVVARCARERPALYTPAAYRR